MSVTKRLKSEYETMSSPYDIKILSKVAYFDRCYTLITYKQYLSESLLNSLLYNDTL